MNSDYHKDEIARHRALWMAVLVRAISDATGLDIDKREQRNNAINWFFAEPYVDPYSLSFELICDELDLPKNKIRQVVRSLVATGKRIRRREGSSFLDAAKKLDPDWFDL